MPSAWRIVKASQAGRAFTGEGAQRTGGRWNLLNPAHPDFRKVAIGKPVPFTFDPRLLA